MLTFELIYIAYVNYIALPSVLTELFEGASTTVQGFGRTSDSSGVSNILMYINPVPVMTNAKVRLLKNLC